MLQTSRHIIPVANLSSEALLPLLSPWVPHIIRLLSAGTKYLLFSDIQQLLQYKNSLYLLCSGNVHFMHSPPASAYFHKLLNCYLSEMKTHYFPSYIHWTTEICGGKVNLFLRFLCFVLFIVILTIKSHSFWSHAIMQFKENLGNVII